MSAGAAADARAVTRSNRAWAWPLALDDYDRRTTLSDGEREALEQLAEQLRHPWPQRRTGPPWQTIDRLVRPLDAAMEAAWRPNTPHHRHAVVDAVGLVLLRCHRDGAAYWGWSDDDWAELAGPNVAEFRSSRPGWSIDGTIRPYVIAAAYLLCGFIALSRLGRFNRVALSQRVFGPAVVDAEIQCLGEVLSGWGYRFVAGRTDHAARLPTVAAHVMLVNRSPLLADLTTEAFGRLRRDPELQGWQANSLHAIQLAAASLGYCEPPPTPGPSRLRDLEGVPATWAQWVTRWYATSTLTGRSRSNVRNTAAKMGRWLAAEHPEITEPGRWSRQTCAAWVAAVDRMRVGDYVQRHVPARAAHDRAGEPLSANAKANLLTATRAFFRDLQEWEWIPRRFDPARALATPRSIYSLLGPNPRVIADDVWAKLLWAGLNLQADDLPAGKAGQWYPIELSRAVTLAWLFSGLRSDEIARLRVGCIRWQHAGVAIRGDAREVLARDAVCLLDVPAHKTGTAFTKPVDPLLGQAIDAWQAVRPEQPRMLDRKTGERVAFLFAYRAHPVAKAYINATIIPSLCRKAGVPPADARGAITSHRARSTIATQLYNAKEPMTLFELQEWLGHRSLDMVRHYAKINPATLAKAYHDAGYFARNVRAIEVLIDRDAVASGAAAAGEPWQHYDLGHGWCSYGFFEQCPHRMACARCDFYTPKASTKGQLLEAKDNLQRMLASIPLTDEERAAVDDGHAALDRLLEQLADVPTPAGPTPRQLGVPATATLLPVIPVDQTKP